MKTYLLDIDKLWGTLQELAPVYERHNLQDDQLAPMEAITSYLEGFLSKEIEESTTDEFFDFLNATKPLMDELENILAKYGEEFSWVDDQLIVMYPSNKVAVIIKQKRGL